eukprot:15446161-Alexandrium_andersonii.AAC.1
MPRRSPAGIYDGWWIRAHSKLPASGLRCFDTLNKAGCASRRRLSGTPWLLENGLPPCRARWPLP